MISGDLRFPLPTVAASLALIAITAFGLCLPDSALAADDRARKLAPLLKPAPRSAKGTDKDIAAPKKVTISVIQHLQASNRTNGPSAESLIETAFRMREDVAPLEALLTAATMISNWREAQALGLFDDNHRFQPIITRGPDEGKTALIEYILLPRHMPEMSKHPANVRIVTPSKKRNDDGQALTEREIAYGQQFTKMIAEATARNERLKVEQGTDLGVAGITTDEEHKKWQYDMEAAGDAAKAAPRINLRARKGASPAHKNQYRWRIDAEAANASQHPTEIKLEYWLVGITDEKNLHYLMKKGEEKLELRAGQVKSLTLWTGKESSYKSKAGELDGLPKKQWGKAKVIFRGYMLRAVHETGEVAVLAPDRHLAHYLATDGGKSTGDLK